MIAPPWAQAHNPSPGLYDGLVALLVGLLIVLLMASPYLAAQAVVSYVRSKALRRRRKLADWAAAHQLGFDERKDSDLSERFPGMYCLRMALGPFALNVMQGRWGGRAVLAFDYCYPAFQRSRRTCDFSAVIAPSDAALQQLFIRPKRFSDTTSDIFGVGDIEFESAEFNRKFCVRAAGKRWAYDVIHPRMMEFLLAAPLFTIQLGAGGVICYRDTLFRPADFEDACRLACGIMDRLPPYVLDAHRPQISGPDQRQETDDL